MAGIVIRQADLFARSWRNGRLTDCWGECPKNRVIRTADGEPGLNYLCRGLKAFFLHAIPEVDRLAAELRNQPLRPRPRM